MISKKIGVPLTSTVKKELLNFQKLSFDEQNARYRIGKGFYKIRIANPKQKHGKRGSFRAHLVLLNINPNLFAPFTFYYKPEKENLTEAELETALDKFEAEYFDYCTRNKK